MAKPKTKPVEEPTEPTLEERIAELHKLIDERIAEKVDALAAVTPGVPKGILEQMLTARARGGLCRCSAFDLIFKDKK